MEKTKVQIELCPICGSAPVLEKTSLDYGNGHGYPGHYDYQIKCISCNMPNFPVSADTVYCKSEEEAINIAIKKWNIQSKAITNNYLLKNTYLKKLMKEEK